MTKYPELHGRSHEDNHLPEVLDGTGGGRTDAGAPHSLGSVSAWAGAVVAASRVLADLIVSALMRPVSALIHV